MGIWDFLSSTTEAVKQRATDPTPLKEAYKTSSDFCSAAAGKIDNVVRVKEAYKTSYDFCSAAAGKMDNVVRVNSQRFIDHMPDEETRAEMGLYTSKFLQNAAQYAQQEVYKFIPGGEALATIVSETIRDVKLEKQNRQEMEAMVEVFRGGQGKNFGVEKRSRGMELGYDKANQSPTELLNNFMKNEFMGNRFAGELVLPQIKNVKKD